MSREALVQVGVTTEVAPGVFATAVIDRPYKKKAGRVARHETLHAVAAAFTGTEIIDATIEPGNGFSGRVRLGRYNAVAFIAPKAFGCDGTGHDEAVVAWMGDDPPEAAARSLLMDKGLEIESVGSRLEEERTISGYQVLEAMEEGRRPKTKTELVDSFGKRWSSVARAHSSMGEFWVPVTIPEPIQ